MVESEDANLVRECLAGNTGAFEKLVLRYQKPMFNVAYQIVNNYDDAADVTQAAFVKAYENLRRFDNQYKFFSWLYRITVNASLNFVASRKPHDELHEGIPSADRTAEEVQSNEDLARGIHRALAKLSPEYRAVIVLSHFRELTYREISEVLGIQEKTVKSRLFTARQQLRDLLSTEGK